MKRYRRYIRLRHTRDDGASRVAPGCRKPRCVVAAADASLAHAASEQTEESIEEQTPAVLRVLFKIRSGAPGVYIARSVSLVCGSALRDRPVTQLLP